ncbi:MAG: cation-translocating P-type ATPase [Victivallales bacterium]
MAELTAENKVFDAHSEICGCDHEHDHEAGGAGHSRSLGRLSVALIGGFFILNSYILRWMQADQDFTSELSAICGAVILALPIFIVAVKDLAKGKVYMNELVALAVLAALSGGDFRTAGIISFFLLIAIIIESRTAHGAQRSIEELIKLTPRSARKISDGQESDVDVLALVIGDIIRIRPGENFPVDGSIVKGSSTVNQASITGESFPVEKEEGNDVFAGTQNLTGVIDVNVTKVGKDTTLGKVKDMILAAETTKPPIVRVIDRYAGYYTPTILMIAGLTWWFSGGNMMNVISVLVASCPCALVLAAPSAVVAALAAAARLGILIKNVSYLELAAKVRAVIFDKTGTLTEGTLSVVRLAPAEGVQPADLLQIAASIESHSNHPTAIALQNLAKEANLKLTEVEKFNEVHGKGVEGFLDGKKSMIGRAEWLKSHEISTDSLETPDTDGGSAMSIVYVASQGKAVGWIGFRDTVRKEAADAIKSLKEDGVKHCAMVTGDRKAVADLVSKELGIENVRAECLPDDKVAYVKEIKHNYTVAVVGDGINDAPALAAGDLGIAMGAIGSDIAINSASIALMTNDLRRIPMLVVLAKQSGKIINQNLLIGFVFIVGGISLSVFGMLPPIIAAALHTVSTTIVLFNSARLVRTGEELTMHETHQEVEEK